MLSYCSSCWSPLQGVMWPDVPVRCRCGAWLLGTRTMTPFEERTQQERAAGVPIQLLEARYLGTQRGNYL